MTVAARPSIFLSAEWRHLVMLNYEVDPVLLARLTPAGTELDDFEGRTFISLVGFEYLDTRVLGLRVPLHGEFEELNLRFYVRRRVGDEERRGVVFIKEIVGRRAVTFVARVVYHENFVTLPMTHAITRTQVGSASRIAATYRWRNRGRWNELRATGEGEPALPPSGSLAKFIIEHYWGYTALDSSRSLEYRVDHPPWRLWTANSAALDCDTEALYGRDLGRVLASAPDSAFLVDGSAISVHRGSRVT